MCCAWNASKYRRPFRVAWRTYHDQDYIITNHRRAAYRLRSFRRASAGGTEPDLGFRTWDKQRYLFAHGTLPDFCLRAHPHQRRRRDLLDPAGYGQVTITKAISIVNDGVGIAAIGGGSALTAVMINAGASDSVHLRGRSRDDSAAGQRMASGSTRAETSPSKTASSGISRLGAFLLGQWRLGPMATTSAPMSFSVSNTIASITALTGSLLPATERQSPACSAESRRIITVISELACRRSGDRSMSQS